MKRTLIFLVVLVFISGCASLNKTTPAYKVVQESIIEEDQKNIKLDKEEVQASAELENVKDEKIEEYKEQRGIVFGKTNFQGVLKASFVKLLFQNREDEKKRFQLYIGGDKEKETPFPWDVKTVKPGYFYVELPVGEYSISSISIPIGSTMATELIDVGFKVTPNKITYIGTLNVLGTKEKIKLGGVPVIRPGFEYVIEILDEEKEGIEMFHKRYPNIIEKILIELMKVKDLE